MNFLNLVELARKYPTDKGTTHTYLEVYDGLFARLRDKSFNLLEIGVCDGGSMMLWRKWFELACIFGVEKFPRIEEVDGCTLFEGDATSEEFAGRLEHLRFGIIIDDGSHILDEQLKTYALLKDKLTPDGIYVVEDLVEDSIQAFEKMGFTVYDRRYLKDVRDDILAVKWVKTT